jgi:hypothetical protein
MARSSRPWARWDAWAPGYGNERRVVNVAEIDLTQVPAEFAGHQMAAPSWAEWVERDPDDAPACGTSANIPYAPELAKVLRN